MPEDTNPNGDIFGGDDGQLIHHFETSRNNALADDPADRITGLLHVVEGAGLGLQARQFVTQHRQRPGVVNVTTDVGIQNARDSCQVTLQNKRCAL